MELRSTEEELQSLRTLYEALCASAPKLQQGTSTATVDWPPLPPAPVVPADPTTACSSTTSSTDSAALVNDQFNGSKKGDVFEAVSSSSAVEILEQLETLRRRLRELDSNTQKLQKRLSDKDPVTNKSRYGEKTAERVQVVLENYRDMCRLVGTIFGEPVIPAETNDTVNSTSTAPVIADSIRQLAQIEVEEHQRRMEDEQRRLQAVEEAHRAAAERVRREEEQAEADRARQAQAALEERARQAAAARAAVERARQAEAAAERAWMESIPNRKTLEGVKEQLSVFAESSPAESMMALHTIFSQIVSHPEEDNYRRIRRDHPRFLNDIGQYAGGREVLIAAGFELGFVEEVPSFVCKEPNIEQDMDGWAAWFDLLKGTLELIEHEMMK